MFPQEGSPGTSPAGSLSPWLEGAKIQMWSLAANGSTLPVFLLDLAVLTHSFCGYQATCQHARRCPYYRIWLLWKELALGISK